MQPGVVLDLLESADSSETCFGALATGLSEQIELRRAAWLTGALARAHWPARFEIEQSVLDRISESADPDTVVRIDAREENEAGGEEPLAVLVVPMDTGSAERSFLVLFCAPSSTADLAVCAEAAKAFGRIAALHERIDEAERRCTELRRRAEETEALHTLGLGINRSLDPGAVAPLVGRLARTLLAAQYAMVYVREGDGLRLAAHTGGKRDDWPAQASADLVRLVDGGYPISLDLDAEGERLPSELQAGAVAAVVAPMTLYGRSVGAIVIGYHRRPALGDRDLRLAATLAGHSAIALSNAQLHHDLAQRTADLERANEELERLSLVKERFFAAMNHELRTPVSAIMGFNQLMMDRQSVGRLPERVEYYLNRSQGVAAGLLTLVNDILDLSKIAAGKMPLVPQQFLLVDLVSDVAETIRPLSRAKAIEVETVVPDDLPPLDTDLTRVRQILLNLATNAVKFTERGRIRIEVPHLDADDSMVEIRVSDTGCGIAPEDLARIFEEFEQAVDADSQRGTGLGLPISRRLARLLGGDLHVESERGAGSTFTLRIPRELRADSAPEPVVSTGEAVSAS